MPASVIKSSTQDHLDIDDVKDNMALLKDGSACLIIETTAVNFSLLSESEQDAIIYAYAGLLNSLTYPIQIVIQSQKKDITSYLLLLEQQKLKIKNPLLKNQLEKYHAFVQKTVTENEVLDKKFYVVIPFSSFELGLFKQSKKTAIDKDFLIQKAKTSLLPKRDHLVQQLNRIGLKAKQLTSQEIIKLLFLYYNPDAGSVNFDKPESYDAPIVQAAISEEKPTPPKP